MARLRGIKKLDLTGLGVVDKGSRKIAIGLGSDAESVLPSDKGGTGLLEVATDNLVTGNGTAAWTAESTLTYNETDGLKITSASASKPIVHLQNSHSGVTGGILKFEKTTTDEAINDVLGNIEFHGKNSNGDTIKYAYIESRSAGVTDGDEKGEVRIHVADQNEGDTLGLSIEADGDDQVKFVLGAGMPNNTIYGNTALSATTAGTPKLSLLNTQNVSNAGTIHFQMSGRSGTADDIVGNILFSGKDASDNTQDYVKILSKSKAVTHGQEGGELIFQVASHNGTLTDGLIIEDGDTTGELDITIGAGSSSLTTLAGRLQVDGSDILLGASDHGLIKSNDTATNTAGKNLTFQGGSPETGTHSDIAGGDLIIQGGQGKGTGEGGDIMFKVSTASGSTGSSLNAYQSVLALYQNLLAKFYGDLQIGGDSLRIDGGNTNIHLSASAHNVAGSDLTISAGSTTAGTTTDIPGGDLTFKGGQGKGSGPGGDIIFQVANASGSSSSLNALATAATISDDKNLTLEADLIVKGGDISGPVDGSLTLKAETDMIFQVDSDTGGTNTFQFKKDDGTEIANLNESGDLQIDGDITVGGQDVKSSNGTTVLTLDDSGNALLANNLTINNVIKARAGFTITGSIDPDGNATAEGSGTEFTTELRIGDQLTVSGETRTITEITSDTVLVTENTFSNNSNDTSPDAIPASLVVTDSSSKPQFMVLTDGIDTQAIIRGDEAQTASLMLRADEGDDAGDTWKMQLLTNNRLQFSNNISGTYAAHMSLTPNATVTDSIFNINGSQTIDGSYLKISGANGHIQIKESADGTSNASFGTLWIKNDDPCTLKYRNDAGVDFDLNNTPGTILGHTMLDPSVAGAQVATTSLVPIHDDAKVSFKTPQSEKVLINFKATLVEGSGLTSTWLSLSSTNKTAGHTDIIANALKQEVNYGSRRRTLLDVTWYLSSSELEAIGDDNDIWVSILASADEYIKWGGTLNGFPPMIITATAL